MTTELAKKISIRSVCGKTAAPSKHVKLMRVYGTVTGLKEGFAESVARPWTALLGRFEAINLASGEIFVSGKLFLPDPAGEMLASAIRSNPSASIDFAVEVGAKPSNTPIGYEYTVSDLSKPAEDNKLLLMREQYAPDKTPVLTHDTAGRDTAGTKKK